eukprot:jgi/Bigna1/75109/fgenesh1_pg.32_\
MSCRPSPITVDPIPEPKKHCINILMKSAHSYPLCAASSRIWHVLVMSLVLPLSVIVECCVIGLVLNSKHASWAISLCGAASLATALGCCLFADEEYAMNCLLLGCAGGFFGFIIRQSISFMKNVKKLYPVRLRNPWMFLVFASTAPAYIYTQVIIWYIEVAVGHRSRASDAFKGLNSGSAGHWGLCLLCPPWIYCV